MTSKKENSCSQRTERTTSKTCGFCGKFCLPEGCTTYSSRPEEPNLSDGNDSPVLRSVPRETCGC
eukprot:1982706-Amphidinium_carterae.1